MLKLLHFVVAAVVIALSAAGCARQRDRSAAPETFRVMTYNIHHAEGTDGRLDLARVARIITENRVDLAAIQEVDVLTKRVPIDEPAELARLTGMHVTFAKAIDYQGGAYGQVVLSRYPISDPRTISLPSRPEKERRIALAVTVSPGGGRRDFRFVTAHLDHQSEDDRVEQARELLKNLSENSAAPTILAGDFNARPASRTMKVVFSRFDDTAGENALAPTGPADRPTLKIDYILTSKNAPWAPIHSSVIDDRVASDHRPVTCDFTWLSSSRTAD
jgi:endonuclease/exonuclease/phosphatase family metal-dependent hydrolase